MIRERNQTFKLAFIGLDLLVSAAAVSSAFFLHFYVISPEKRDFVVPDKGGNFAPFAYIPDEWSLVAVYLFLGAMITISQVVVFIATDLYHPRRGINYVREFIAIVRGVAINLLFVLAILFFYRGVSFSRLVIVYIALFSITYHAVGHYFFRQFLGRLRSRGYNTRAVLMIGTGSGAINFAETLKRHAIYGYKIVGMLGPTAGLSEPYTALVRGHVNQFKSVAAKLQPDMIIYAMTAEQERLTEVVDFCDQEGIDCRIVPDWVDFITHRARIEAMDGIPILTIRDIPLRNGYYKFIKRIFDLISSSCALILAAPFLLLTALLIKLSSKGPVFFSQERVGMDRRTFKIYKFRTMSVQTKEGSDTTWGSADDARVTGIGKFLRKTSLDELPQLWNVLIGNMSVVGPRPERPHFVSEFKSRYTHYMRRHAVKSGLTGWAQIQGLRGDTSIQERVEADIYYIENWTFWLDIIIILRTIPSMIKNPGE